MPTNHIAEFFASARERYRIKLKRDAGEPWPWTDDRVFKEWRFTNIFREDDRTTTWFRENVRSELSARGDKLKIVEATMIFRWFNRVETGIIIKDLLLDGWNGKEAHERLKNVRPIVTGAYIIKTFNDLNKLDGILLAIQGALPLLPRMVPRWGSTLQGAWRDLKTIHFIGGFMAHEIVQDLRYTPVLCDATDIMTWGNLGPGAIRGMGWVVAGSPNFFVNSVENQKEMLGMMAELLALSREDENWPHNWPPWEMHQVEFWLCEFSKYMNAKRGVPQKRRYQQ